VLGGEGHVVVPPRPEVADRIAGGLELGLAGDVALQATIRERVEQAALVAKEPVQDGLRHADGLAHGARGDLTVGRGDELGLGGIEQGGAEGCGVSGDAPSLPIRIVASSRATVGGVVVIRISRITERHQMSTAPERVAVVTGASRGIGRAIAERLAADGLSVVVNYATGAAPAEETVAAITAAGGRAIAVAADVADESAVTAMFDRARDELGGVDVVVHSAGRLALSTIADLDLEVLDDLHRTNIRGTFVVAQQAARRLRDGGAYVSLSTSVVGAQFPTYGAYAASKGAVEAMTLILARELRGRDITVNAVAPGPTATAFFLDGKTQEQIDGLVKVPPLERLGTPEDIAGVVAFLASPDGHWVNGQTLRANGGMN
jgi:3-oxoacyl-[acyl-carrier protein] reductase